MRICVLSGGRSSEHEVSLHSGEAVAAGLREGGHDVLDLRIDRGGRWTHDGSPLELIPAGGLLGVDAAFPVLHGPYGEDGTIQGVLEALDVPYVGSDVLASAICLDKITFKRLMAARGIPQVAFCAAGEDGWLEQAMGLGSPVWVKPSRLGSSVGISRVDAPADLESAVELARRHDPRVIIEASATGKEVECSLLGNEEPVASVPGEIVAHAEWYDFKAKYEPGGMELLIPAGIDAAALERVSVLAIQVFKAAGCSGLARCDFFVSDAGEVLVNELNTIPGFTETSVYSKLFEASGIGYVELCDKLVALAIERHQQGRPG